MLRDWLSSLFTCKTLGFANESRAAMSADILKSRGFLSALMQHLVATNFLEQSAFMFTSGTVLDKLLSFVVVGVLTRLQNYTFRHYDRLNAELISELNATEKELLEHLNAEFERNALDSSESQELQRYYRLVLDRHVGTINMLKNVIAICCLTAGIAANRGLWRPQEILAIVAFCNAIGNDAVNVASAINDASVRCNDLEDEADGAIDELMANANIIYESKNGRGYIDAIHGSMCEYNELNRDSGHISTVNRPLMRSLQFAYTLFSVLKLFVTIDTYDIHVLQELEHCLIRIIYCATRLKKVQDKLDKLELTRLESRLRSSRFGPRPSESVRLDESRPAFEVQPFRFAYPEQPSCVLNVTRTVQVPSRAWTFFQGNSGTGKTTFIRLLLKLIAPGEVDVAFFGHRQHSCAAIRDHVRFVKPTGDIFINRTVEFNVTFGVRASSTMSEDDVTGTIARYFTLFELGEYSTLAHKPIRSMSTGEQQRIKIVRLIVGTFSDPRRSVWIMDEMTSNVDAAVEAVILHELKRVQRALGLSVIHISHNPASRSYCDYYMRIDDARDVVISPA